MPRPDIPHVRNLFFEIRNEVFTDLDGDVLSLYSDRDRQAIVN